jgi:cytochrome bd-type quinol oxidase subunit 1
MSRASGWRVVLQTVNQEDSVPNVADLLHEISVFAMLSMAVSVAAFALGVSYVIRPTEQRLMLMRPVSLAAIFSAVSGLSSGWAAILAGVAATADGHLPVAAVSRGVAETLTLGFVCFGFLAVAWLLAAVGMLRRGGEVETA